MLPPDLDIAHASAILLLLFAWVAYPVFLKLLGTKSLNSQLETVRRRWILAMIERTAKPFDAVLLGHIINSVAFFGSATLLVLAGVVSVMTGVEKLHQTFQSLHFVSDITLELFVLQCAVLAFVVGVSFFSFTYSLRKLIYLLALVGALPEGVTSQDDALDEQVNQSAIVLTEAVKTFNFGIRGYYYAVATLFLFVSPLASIIVTVLVTVILLYRQMATKTSEAIRRYVEADRDV